MHVIYTSHFRIMERLLLPCVDCNYVLVNVINIVGIATIATM